MAKAKPCLYRDIWMKCQSLHSTASPQANGKRRDPTWEVSCVLRHTCKYRTWGCNTQEKTLDIAPGEACFPGANQPFFVAPKITQVDSTFESQRC